MDPAKKRRRSERTKGATSQEVHSGAASSSPSPSLGIETEEDREKALADAELKNLWDATEVIDMDTV
jgi:predicted trehalose synthase